MKKINLIQIFVSLCIFFIALSSFARMPLSFKAGEIAFIAGEYEDAIEVYKECLEKPALTTDDKATIRIAIARAYCGILAWNSAERELRWVLANSKNERLKYEAQKLLEIVMAPDEPGVIKKNLGPGVNSSYEEVAPVIAPDGKTIYFIVDSPPRGLGKQDIFYSKCNVDGSWGEAINMGSPINTRGNDGILSISPDGTKALLAGIYNPDGSKSNGFSFANLRGGIWRDPEPLKIDDFYNKNTNTSACLSASGKEIILALEREGGFGDLDLYVCFLKPDDSWTTPLNLGSKINTRKTDGTPFLASDGRTLYFSSDGHIGLGRQDMFKSERLDDSWTKWSEPVNLGKQLNTAGWDAYYTIPASGDIAYFVSGAEGGFGKSDIWSVTLPQSAKPGAVVTVSGKVMEPDSTPVGADVLWEKLANGENMGRARSNDKTGYYMIILPVGESYGYVAQKEGYLPTSANLDLTNAKAFDEVHHDIIIVPIRKGAQTILKNIFFDFDKATLRPESIGELKRVLKLMEDNPRMKVEIAGHTDSIGTDVYNQRLSNDRARAVADWLTKNGISEKRLVVRGYGETKPIADNATEEGRQKNRRVVFEVIEY